MSGKDTKTEKVKLEGLREVDKKKSVEKEEKEEIVYTSPVKIGNKKYVIKPISMRDIRKLNIERKAIKKDDSIGIYDHSFNVLLTVIKKWNPEAKDIKVEEFQEMISIVEFERVQAAILQITGLKKYFLLGASGK